MYEFLDFDYEISFFTTLCVLFSTTQISVNYTLSIPKLSRVNVFYISYIFFSKKSTKTPLNILYFISYTSILSIYFSFMCYIIYTNINDVFSILFSRISCIISLPRNDKCEEKYGKFSTSNTHNIIIILSCLVYNTV